MFRQIAEDIFTILEPRMLEENINIIKNTHGKKSHAPRACKLGSSVYILLSESGTVLYVGETGISIKSRCFGDGTGAHCRKPWFKNVTTVKHFTTDTEADFSVMNRKLAEQALSIHLLPTYYG